MMNQDIDHFKNCSHADLQLPFYINLTFNIIKILFTYLYMYLTIDTDENLEFLYEKYI